MGIYLPSVYVCIVASERKLNKIGRLVDFNMLICENSSVLVGSEVGKQGYNFF